MTNNLFKLIDTLETEHSLSENEYKALLDGYSEELAEYAAKKADRLRREIYGTKVFLRGLIEISNYCKNDCLYCGIRRGNKACSRYRLTREEILECCTEGYRLGFRTFVLQGGEDMSLDDDWICTVVREIKELFSDAAVTLSLGERSDESYAAFKEAGVDRYLLRHETADGEHYKKLHPKEMSFSNRIRCLYTLKSLGFQVGAGFMVGSPYQTTAHLAADLKFIEEFKPDMCGIGPFIPHKDTPFGEFSAGSVELTCFLISLVRLIYPPVLLPATTALGTRAMGGREKGIKSGANIVMPNLSPSSVRKKYQLYNNKLSDGCEAAEGKATLERLLNKIGYQVSLERGDIIK